MKYNYEDYIFLCARLNARKERLISKERCECLVSANNDEEFFARASEFLGESGGLNGDAFTLPELRFDREFAEVLESVPDPWLFSFFTYPYDCHNLKTAVKCEIKGVSAEGFLIPRGSVPVQGLCELFRKRELSAFPECMARAVSEALDVYAKSRAPQAVDIILDSACFEDMARSVNKNPLKYFKRLLEIKADTTNILTCVRIIKSSVADAERLMTQAFAVGGRIERSIFAEVLAKEERKTALASVLQADGYEKISEKLNGDLSEISKACRLEYLKNALGVSSTAIGAELVARYLTLLELEAENIRRVMTYRRLGYTWEKMLDMLYEVG